MVLNGKMLVAVMTLLALVVLGVGSTFAQSGGTRPGWGYGDQNHVHTGPPGQSVRPNK